MKVEVNEIHFDEGFFQKCYYNVFVKYKDGTEELFEELYITQKAEQEKN